MRKILTVLFLSIATVALAQLNDGDMSRYLKGAVPEVDGKVVFSEVVNIVPGYSAEQVKSIGKGWMESYLSGFDVQRNRIISDEGNSVTAICEMEIIFKKSGFILDKGIITFAMILDCNAEEAKLSITRIKYKYRFVDDIELITAEDYITDKDAINKHNTKLLPITGKFRKGTIDFIDEIFKGFNDAYKLYSKSAVAAAVVQAPQVMAAQPVQPAQQVQQAQQAQQAQPVQPAQPVQATQAAQAAQTTPPAQAAQAAQAAQVAAPVKSSVVAALPVSEEVSMEGYKKIAPESIPGNFIKMVSQDWMLVTAGSKDKFNMMTASWGGIGVLFNKPVAICYINPARYTYQIIENSDTYTLTFYTEAYRDALNYCGTKSGRDEDKVKGSGLTPVELDGGSMAFKEAWMIIECKKLVSQSLSLDAIDNPQEKAKRATAPMHKMYIGEIVNVWVK